MGENESRSATVIILPATKEASETCIKTNHSLGASVDDPSHGITKEAPSNPHHTVANTLQPVNSNHLPNTTTSSQLCAQEKSSRPQAHQPSSTTTTTLCHTQGLAAARAPCRKSLRHQECERKDIDHGAGSKSVTSGNCQAYIRWELIFAESLEVLVMALEALHEEAKPLGLEVSWLKTKVQVSVRACGEDKIRIFQVACDPCLTLCTKDTPRCLVELVSDDVTFPDTRATQETFIKIMLRNLDKTVHSVQAEVTNGPFIVRHTQFTIKSGHYVSVPVYFKPQKSGLWTGYLRLTVVKNKMVLSARLSGRSLP
ncbi:Centrosomal protein [Chionoecetes opilio]|uniref:Centrosomal protein n=1 Tax=Chionoecetes opilio TaxID=41210 RepID=A0A8J4Y614_CHIOP|nr:Centrosomal protein [Chionoecetes opilio]